MVISKISIKLVFFPVQLLVILGIRRLNVSPGARIAFSPFHEFDEWLLSLPALALYFMIKLLTSAVWAWVGWVTIMRGPQSIKNDDARLIKMATHPVSTCPCPVFPDPCGAVAFFLLAIAIDIWKAAMSERYAFSTAAAVCAVHLLIISLWCAQEYAS